MKALIKKLLRENVNQLKFNKIEVELFTSSEGTSTDYESGSSDSSSYQTPKDKRVKIRVTPIIDLTHKYDRNKSQNVSKHGEEYDNFFDYDEGIDLSGVVKFSSGDGANTVVLCQEGILTYESHSDADCDGSSYSFKGKFIPYSEITEWGKIKEFIKPRLKQSNIDDAIRTIGKEKEFCKVTNYTGKFREGDDCEYLKKLKKENKIDGFTPLSNSWDCSQRTIIKINGKYGIGYVRNNALISLIPYIYDKYEYNEKTKELSVIKGDIGYVYAYKNGKFGVVNKFDLKEKRMQAARTIDKMEEMYQKAIDKNEYNGRFIQWLKDYYLYDDYDNLLKQL
jgi:hypothetical protein